MLKLSDDPLANRLGDSVIKKTQYSSLSHLAQMLLLKL